MTTKQQGARIAVIRKMRGIRQDQVATALRQSRSAVSSWERGRYEVDTVTMAQLCQLFDVSMDVLTGAARKPYTRAA